MATGLYQKRRQSIRVRVYRAQFSEGLGITDQDFGAPGGDSRLVRPVSAQRAMPRQVFLEKIGDDGYARRPVDPRALIARQLGDDQTPVVRNAYQRMADVAGQHAFDTGQAENMLNQGGRR